MQIHPSAPPDIPSSYFLSEESHVCVMLLMAFLSTLLFSRSAIEQILNPVCHE